MPPRASRGHRASQVARQSPRYAAEAKALGSRVRELREQRGWTLERADETSGIDWKHWQKIEAGQINVTLVTLTRLAEAFGEPVSSLFVSVRGRSKK
jgi:transcriptional regulator with XRE-family HTH domain